MRDVQTDCLQPMPYQGKPLTFKKKKKTFFRPTERSLTEAGLIVGELVLLYAICQSFYELFPTIK